MISNIQHQNIEGVVKEILKNSTDNNENPNFFNNNNTQKNKNLSMMMTTATAPPNMDATTLVMNFNSTTNGCQLYDSQNGYNKTLAANSLTLKVNNDDKFLLNRKKEIQSSEEDKTKDSVNFTTNTNNVDDNMKNCSFLNDVAKSEAASSVKVNSTPKKTTAKKIDEKCALISHQQSSDSNISDTKYISDKNEKCLQFFKTDELNVEKELINKHAKNSTNERKIKPINSKNVDQNKNILRRIEDVHNYSKLSRCDESTTFSNCQNEEEIDNGDDDAEDIVDDINNYVTKSTMAQKKQNDILPKTNGSEMINCVINAKENSLATPTNEAKNNYDILEDEDKTPDHHTRRPMNAFLIFCKRHRAIVREKYKHLENRSITKILGDWWATLDAEEKKAYTNLAKQYKDAFFSANPNFKWYKLPAPPLRTLTTRPVKEERSLSESQDYEIKDLSSDTSTQNHFDNEKSEEFYNEENFRNDKNPTSHYNSTLNENELSGVGSFKLADENQMGNLSSLMVQCSNPFKFNRSRSPQESEPKTKTDSNITVQQGNTTEFSAHDNSNSKLTTNMSGKRKTLDSSYPLNDYKKPMLSSDNSFSSGEEDIFQKKPTRSCKGKKYQEFLNSGQIIVSAKKSKIKTTHSSSHDFPYNNAYCKPYKFASNEKSERTLENCRTTEKYNFDSKNLINQQYISLKMNKDSGKVPLSSPINEEYHFQYPKHHPNDISLNCNNTNLGKQFDAVDFDLECKIKALPAQNLDNYLEKKKQTKKKKKINSKRHTSRTNSSSIKQQKSQMFSSPQVNIDQQNVQNASTMIVGSQKRKARKESITRRDVNSINNEVQSILEAMATSSSANASTICVGLEPSHDQYPHIEAKAEESFLVNLQCTEENLLAENSATGKPIEIDEKPDLLILAEVATNHIEINNT